ncbi:sugar kinase [Georgenia yuyongxinii]
MPLPDPQVLCVGETMALVAPDGSVPLADARSVHLTSAGAESNVARHLADLGVPTAWLSALGTDPLGDRVLADLAGNGVDLRWVTRRSDAPTGVFFKDPSPKGTRVLYYRAGSAASRLAPDDVGGWPLARARWVHVTGITPALSASCADMVQTLLAGARRHRLGVSFDVNHRPALWHDGDAPGVLRGLADRADVVLVGRDEAERLWDTRTAEDVADLLPTPSRIVVKDADREAVEIDRTAEGTIVTHVPARRVDVVEPVGAGDAFAGGYLAALLRGDGPAKRLAMGHSLAAWTLGTTADYRGGHGSMPHAAEDNRMERTR